MNQTITILRSNFPSADIADEIEADVEGCWAIHETIPVSFGGWTLTHIPTRRAVLTGKLRGQCVACRAKLLAGSLDWSGIAKPADMTPAHRAMGKRLREKYGSE